MAHGRNVVPGRNAAEAKVEEVLGVALGGEQDVLDERLLLFRLVLHLAGGVDE